MSEKSVTYQLGAGGEFIIEQYNDAKPFSSFFPGVAGMHGIPMWTFYVNRGQCIASAGVGDKHQSMMEFLSANRAYQLTPTQGFRTFLKITRNGETEFYEPFQNHITHIGMKRNQRMIIEPNALILEEQNSTLGLNFRVSYSPASEESFAALLRTVQIENTGKNPVQIEALDGLALMVPYGVDNENLKEMRYLVQSFVECVNLENNVPFFKGKVKQMDTPQVHRITRGNFYAAFTENRGKTKLVNPVVDPACVFGARQDLSYPENFLQTKGPFKPGAQRLENVLPCALAHVKLTAAPGRTGTFYAIAGHCSNRDMLNRLIPRIAQASFFAEQREIGKRVVEQLSQYNFICSNSPPFDYYCRQNFLDNTLRGGLPVTFSSKAGKKTTFHVYSRAHGDLERDYNSFFIDPTPYSQGNGAYRDINQNRRMDVLLNPNVGMNNILHFFNLNQLDGFNPLTVMPSSFTARKGKALSTLLKSCVPPGKTTRLETLVTSPFRPGDLCMKLQQEGVNLKTSTDTFLAELLPLCERSEETRYGHSYWSDHWHYSLDLIDNFLAVYPDKLRELLIETRQFTFYDNSHVVRPRADKYVLWDELPMQLEAVAQDPAKEKMIQSRNKDKHAVRTRHGMGDVYQTNLLAKLLTMITCKMASLDMAGVGIEMESERPNWYDALNGLPGMFGSSISETLELKRFVRFCRQALQRLNLEPEHEVILPVEVLEFLNGLDALLIKNLKNKSAEADFRYWDASASLKEIYRRSVLMGLDGAETGLKIKSLGAMLERFERKLDRAVAKAMDSKTGVIKTYFRTEILKHSLIHIRDKNGKRVVKTNAKGMPCFIPQKIRHRALPLFLEGPVHFLRVEGPSAQAQALVQQVRKSDLFDRKLKMFKVNADLSAEALEIGRCRTFARGWLENESIWMHMEYKYMLELLRGGHLKEFFTHFRNVLVPFQDPAVYGRSILENSSFIASSANPDSQIHGAGFFARLSGSTAEFAHMLSLMTVGPTPFRQDADGSLLFAPAPTLPAWLFTEKPTDKTLWKEERERPLSFEKNTFSFMFMGGTLITYSNPKRRDTFGAKAVKPVRFNVTTRGGVVKEFSGETLNTQTAQAIRQGDVASIEITLG
ncbi:MAG: hypothetical protein PHP44_00070 [Kiritimatiellae bacterium]|nr:hypothetical protein [Kiritimatiellia bacterium]